MQEFRARSPNQHAAMIFHINSVSWDCVLQEGDAQVAFDQFNHIMLNISDYFYPIRSITGTNRDPHFVNPAIKALLRKRNRLNRC